jgi:hypothetical protein
MRTRPVTLIFALALLGWGCQLSAQTEPEHVHVKAAPSTNLQLTIESKTSTVTPEDLAAMPQKTVTVRNEHTKKDESYTGVALGDLLAKYGFAMGQATHRKMLHSYIVAEGTDNYWVLYSVTEIESSEHTADVVIATSLDAKPLGEDGKLKLVASADKKPQRWVRNLSAIRLVTVGE